MTPAQMNKEIGSGRFRPVYFFYGEEDYRKTEAVKYLAANFLPPPQRLLNFIRCGADQVDFDRICAELTMVPMLGERKVIVIEEVQRLKPTQQKQMFDLLVPPAPEMVVVLVVAAEHTPRKDSAFFRDVTGLAEPVQFNRLESDDARGRIVRHLEKNSLTADAEAIDLLIALTGGDFGGLMSELDKLSLAVEPGGRITVGQVAAMANSYEEYSIFEMIDFVAEKEVQRALGAYHDLLHKGMSPVGVLAMLSGHLINLVKIQTGKKVGGAPFYLGKLRRQGEMMGTDAALAGLAQIATAEREIRHSHPRPAVLVENLIREISQK
jgi:DNA polymerase-3 subunit delta